MQFTAFKLVISLEFSFEIGVMLKQYLQLSTSLKQNPGCASQHITLASDN